VNTNESGAYSGVSVYRQKAGAVTVSATVGSVKGDVGLSYLAAAETTGAAIELTTPASIASGSTFQVKAKLTDKYGNPVKVTTAGLLSVKYTGPGYVTATLPSTTDASGELSFSVLLGSADEGAATVTVTYDGDATASTTTDNVSKTATLTIGGTPEVNAVIGSFQGRWAVRVENAKGSTVTVKVGGKWYKYTSLNANYTFARKSKVGASVLIRVWVDGELQNEQTTIIK
jgi:hypothetical protein